MLRGKHWDDGWLTAYWGRESRGSKMDLIFASPCRPDGHLLYGSFCCAEVTKGKTLLQELTERGYDISTLQFSVKRKWTPNERFGPELA